MLKPLITILFSLACVYSVYAKEITITPTGDDDATMIQATLDTLKHGDTLLLIGNFVIGHTIYLPSDFVWILDGSLTLGANPALDKVGWVGEVNGFSVNALRYTGITEKNWNTTGASNIDMSGGIYNGNYVTQGASRVRFINFVRVTNSNFHDMEIKKASDDNFTLGPDSRYNECRNLLSTLAGLAPGSTSGNALTDKGDHNKWYDCIAADCTSDGWTPKCRNSEFHRCVARGNEGPGFGMFCRVDGSGDPVDLGETIESNKFYDCESYENNASGFSFNISSTSGEGGSIRNNFVQARCYNNEESGVRFRNKQPNSIIENNVINIICFGNRGLRKSGDPSSLAGGLGTEGKSSSPVRGITGSVICYDNSQVDVNTNQATGCKIVVYNPNDQNLAVLKQGASSNILTQVSFDCSDSLEKWCQFKYCGVQTPPMPHAPFDLKGDVVGPSQIDLSWSDTTGNENGFIIQQKTSGSYSIVATLDANVTSFSSTGLSELTEYFYRVQAFNISGYSEYSNEISVTTEADMNTSSKIPSTGIDLMLRNYPNPFHSTTRITFTIPSCCLVSLKVYDLTGKELGIMVNKKQPGGNYEMIFDGSHLSSGTYFYKLRAGDYLASSRFVLM